MAAIKKTVKTRSDLNSLALSSGATVTSDSGQKFNTQKKRAVKKKRLEPVENNTGLKPALPEVKKSDPGPQIIANAVESAAKANLMMMAELKQQISQIQLKSAMPITEWEFDMIRDGKGYLTTIKARAGAPSGRLN